MKKNLVLFLFAVLTLSACKKNPAPPTKGKLTIKFNHQINGQALTNGQLNYTNAAGNKYSVSLFKYFISNVVLVKDDNTEVKLNNYDLINAFEPANFSTVEASDLPYGNYTSIRFYMGVDSARNHNGAQDGDLDPAYGMIWDWNTGYIFFKHEGKFITTIGDTIDLQYHLGTDRALSTINIPITLNMDAETKKVNLLFDLNKMYNSPVINFNDGPNRQSTNAADFNWINEMSSNTVDAFTFMNQE